MSEEIRSRYPGAQPFSDDDLSRKIFFGRRRESTLLTDQVIANRLVVVYARSGLGKSSLLNAGVAQPLRSEHFLPLTVRINVPTQDLIVSVMQGCTTSAQNQHVEYHPGDDSSLWHFFKTVEFWQGDVLLTPVLVLDQFEELFTLHPPAVRDELLASLGHLIRGIRPLHVAGDRDKQLSDTAPAVRVLISIREDFLGFLEEASDRIPQILDQRFRLLPLSLSAATEALVEPARVADISFDTPAFEYTDDAKRLVLDYLSKRGETQARESKSAIEPFQLQLICQRVEESVAVRSKSGHLIHPITVEDLGGQSGLTSTLTNFYLSQVASIQKRRVRQRVKHLCEEYLINPEGRRISMEGGEIRRVLRINEAALNDLVNRRLLRCDQRANTVYYELSHDSLVAPILASRRVRGLAFGAARLLFGILLLFLGLILNAAAVWFIVMAVAAFFFPEAQFVHDFIESFKQGQAKSGNPEDISIWFLLFFLIVLFFAIGMAVILWMITTFRRSAESLRRYSHREQLATRNQRLTRLTAGVLGILLGGLGIHKFYLGYYSQGVILLGCSLIGALFPWYVGTLAIMLLGLIEGLIYLTKSDDQFVAQYLQSRRAWF